MKKFLPYLNKEVEAKETNFLRFSSMNKLVFLSENIYYNKSSSGWNFFGSENIEFAKTLRNVKKWSIESDISLFKELDTQKLIKGIASINESN